MMLAPQRLAALLAFAALGLLSACAQIRMGQPVPSIDNIRQARGAGIAPVALGGFVLAPGRPQSMDQRVSVRTNTVYAPTQSSFAKYLRETFATDLAAAGLLDPASSIVIEAQLTDNQLDAPSGHAHARVAARFKVLRGGRPVYDKELSASDSWESPFIGVEAIPQAINKHGLLFRELLRKLMADSDFVSAARR